MTEDETVGWNHQLNEHEIEQALGASYGQGSLVCCSPWGCKDSNATELNFSLTFCPIFFFGLFFLGI